MHLWFFTLFSTFAVLPAAYACAVWIGGSAIYYLSTIFGEPEHTGEGPLFLVTMRACTLRAKLCPCIFNLWGSNCVSGLTHTHCNLTLNSLHGMVYERYACKAEVFSPHKLFRYERLHLCAGKREWPAFRDWFAHNLAPR